MNAVYNDPPRQTAETGHGGGQLARRMEPSGFGAFIEPTRNSGGVEMCVKLVSFRRIILSACWGDNAVWWKGFRNQNPYS